MRAAVVVVLLAALFFGYPQPDLKYEEEILPLARAYAKVDDPNSSTPLKGVRIIVTGATSGIGLGLTKTLTNLGATVIALGRSEQKLKALEQQFKGVVTVQVQLGDLESVKQASQEIAARFDAIDAVVNNAGMHYTAGTGGAPAVTPQNYDLSFGVNYLSHFLLTEHMIPLLNSSTKTPTIVQISSSMHWLVDGSDLLPKNDNSMPLAAVPGGFTGLNPSQLAYGTSKLAQILHARSLQRRHPKIQFKSICPCWVGTSIAGDWFEPVLKTFAFPYDGYGIKSAMVALLNPNLPVDFISNSQVTDSTLLFSSFISKPWVYRWGFRDLCLGSIAVAMVFLQKFFADLAYAPSSPESYNETIQESLYQWSYRAVSPYL